MNTIQHLFPDREILANRTSRELAQAKDLEALRGADTGALPKRWRTNHMAEGSSGGF